MTRPMRRGGNRMMVALLVATGGVGLAPAVASGAPSAASSLAGTWTASAASGIVKLVITQSGKGGIAVDAFSECGRSKPCEAGRISAVVFGAAADSTRGRSFETNQRFASYSQVLLGELVSTSRGQRIALDWYDVYNDGSRYGSAATRTFKRVGPATSTTRKGRSTAGYPTFRQPTASDAFVGVWHNINAGTRGLVELDITRETDGSLLVHQFGACTPTPCDNGATAAIAYGASTTSPTGTRFLAPTDYGFKRGLLAAQPISKSGVLTVRLYSEFTDGSSRANYVITEQFTK